MTIAGIIIASSSDFDDVYVRSLDYSNKSLTQGTTQRHYYNDKSAIEFSASYSTGAKVITHCSVIDDDTSTASKMHTLTVCTHKATETSSFDSLSKLSDAIRNNASNLCYSFKRYNHNGWYSSTTIDQHTGLHAVIDYHVGELSDVDQRKVYLELIA